MSRNVKNKLRELDLLVKQIKTATPRTAGEAAHTRKERVEHLLNNWPQFLKYYFPNWAKSDFAKFHLTGADKVLNWKDKKMITAWAVARNLSKTTFWQMFSMYLNVRAVTPLSSGGMRSKGFSTGLFFSKTGDQAAKQVTAMRMQFEFNQRLIQDFGEFKTVGQWDEKFFKTSQGISWLPLGKGQSPRGTKDDEVRVNLIIGDDFDDDEECRNDKRLEQSWDWITRALLPTLDVSAEALVVLLNNIIHQNSLMSRAIGRVKDVEPIVDWYQVVNLLNEKRTKPSWPERHTMADCEYMIRKVGKFAAEAEYFNNPIVNGKVFQQDWIQYKPMKDLRNYTALVAYLDPSFSAKKNADHKSWILIGLTEGQYHIIKAYCGVATIEEMVEWGYEIDTYAKKHNGAVQFFMEEVFFQSILYKDFNAAAKRKGYPLSIQGDTRQKPDKDQRIMSLSGHFERGEWFFNEEERHNHHMKNLVFQFLAFAPGFTGIKKDGPDACEGGKEKCIEVLNTMMPSKAGQRKKSKNMY